MTPSVSLDVFSPDPDPPGFVVEPERVVARKPGLVEDERSTADVGFPDPARKPLDAQSCPRRDDVFGIRSEGFMARELRAPVGLLLLPRHHSPTIDADMLLSSCPSRAAAA